MAVIMQWQSSLETNLQVIDSYKLQVTVTSFPLGVGWAKGGCRICLAWGPSLLIHRLGAQGSVSEPHFVTAPVCLPSSQHAADTEPSWHIFFAHLVLLNKSPIFTHHSPSLGWSHCTFRKITFLHPPVQIQTLIISRSRYQIPTQLALKIWSHHEALWTYNLAFNDDLAELLLNVLWVK